MKRKIQVRKVQGWWIVSLPSAAWEEGLRLWRNMFYFTTFKEAIRFTQAVLWERWDERWNNEH